MKIASTKNEMPSSAKRDPEDLAEAGHELRPQQAELERQDRAGHDADGEQRHRHLRPALGQRLVGRVAGAQVEALDEQRSSPGRRSRSTRSGCARPARAPASGAPRAGPGARRPARARRYCSRRSDERSPASPCFGYDLRYAHGEYVMSGGRTITSLPSTVVRLETDDGLRGYGRDVPARPGLPAGARRRRAGGAARARAGAARRRPAQPQRGQRRHGRRAARATATPRRRSTSPAGTCSARPRGCR